MAPPETSRRLATILAADVVGYSRLMAEDEEDTVRTLRAHREIIDRLIARHDGRIFNTAGDSVLAEFGSAVEAVRCATTVQDELRVRNAELPEARRMLFRIGINLGDVIVDGDNLLGDGINVAARLESIAPPGGVCISGGTFEQIKNKLSIGFEDLGPQSVKNIPEPVAAFRITGAPVSVSSTATTAAPGEARGRFPTGAALGGLALVVALSAGAWLLLGRDVLLPHPAASPPGAEATPAIPPVSDRVSGHGTPSRTPTAAPSTEPAKRTAPPPAVMTAPPPPATPPPTGPTTTRDLAAAEITRLMTGLSIRGMRRKDGQPFTIELGDDGKLAYSFPRSGAGAGTTFRATGHWRVADGLFCMRMRGFNEGQETCPVFVRDGDRITATRPNGQRLDWTVLRNTSQPNASTPRTVANSSDAMDAAQIAALVTGTTLHGTRQRDNAPFAIVLAEGGVANFTLERADKPPYTEAGRWWSEDYRFCMQFKQALMGRESCPRIVSENDRLRLTRGDGSPLDWTLAR